MSPRSPGYAFGDISCACSVSFLANSHTAQ